MYGFHLNKPQYFNYQYQTAREYVVPFIEEKKRLREGMRVLEIGCGEAGVLKAFLERGCVCVGVDMAENRIALAREFLGEEYEAGRVRLLSKDIYDVVPETDFGGGFDLIVLKDVIEHIHDQARFMERMKDFLNPGGAVFFGFPPWQMPYGGHQQICNSRLLSKLPYFHLLPRRVYGFVLSRFEHRARVDELLEIQETGLSIERFERIVHKTGYRVALRRHYLINPIYRDKFGLKPREQAGFISAIPWFRNFVTTGVYYLVERN